MLTLAGEPSDRAARDAESVLTIEHALASHAMDPAARRDPNARNHPMRVAELCRL